ncbi:regulator of sigma E protease, partial [Trypanosoma cruzi]
QKQQSSTTQIRRSPLCTPQLCTAQSFCAQFLAHTGPNAAGYQWLSVAVACGPPPPAGVFRPPQLGKTPLRRLRNGKKNGGDNAIRDGYRVHLTHRSQTLCWDKEDRDASHARQTPIGNKGLKNGQPQPGETHSGTTEEARWCTVAQRDREGEGGGEGCGGKGRVSPVPVVGSWVHGGVTHRHGHTNASIDRIMKSSVALRVSRRRCCSCGPD